MNCCLSIREGWHWGEDTCGQVGKGFHYDSYFPVTMVPGGDSVDSIQVFAYTEKPEPILENVREMYFEKNCMYAKDGENNLWQWGDAPVGFYAPVRDNTYYMMEAVAPEQKYCVPRRNEKVQPEYKDINNIMLGTDGSLYITYFDNVADGKKEIKFPVNLAEVMKATAPST